jgi:hypothetical protein
MWLLAQLNGLLRARERRPDARSGVGRQDAVRARYGDLPPVVAHPEGVEIARQRMETNLEDHLNFPDKKIRLAPEPIIPEIRRAIATEPTVDPAFP